MRFGLALMNDFPPGTTVADRVPQLREQVRSAREAGLSSVWLLHHYLGNMPTLQPIPTLAALAADAAGELDLGTNMFILPLHHPVEVAEAYATLDHITGGHVIAGFGMGYRENEFTAFGVPMAQRASRYEESVTLIRELWGGEPVTFRGEHYTLDGERISLPPVRPGGPPIWVGAGAHRTGALRAARLGDAWIVPPHVSQDRLWKTLEIYRAERDQLGRAGDREVVLRRELVLDPDPERARAEGIAARTALTRQYAAYNAPDRTASYRQLWDERAVAEVADESYLFTDPATCVARLRELAAAGVTYVILRMQWFDLPHERMLATLERFRTEVLPQLDSPSSTTASSGQASTASRA